MSRKEEIKKGIREQGLIFDENLIDQIAEEKMHHERLKKLQENIQKKIKDALRKSAS